MAEINTILQSDYPPIKNVIIYIYIYLFNSPPTASAAHETTTGKMLSEKQVPRRMSIAGLHVEGTFLNQGVVRWVALEKSSFLFNRLFTMTSLNPLSFHQK